MDHADVLGTESARPLNPLRRHPHAVFRHWSKGGVPRPERSLPVLSASWGGRDAGRIGDREGRAGGGPARHSLRFHRLWTAAVRLEPDRRAAFGRLGLDRAGRGQGWRPHDSGTGARHPFRHRDLHGGGVRACRAALAGARRKAGALGLGLWLRPLRRDELSRGPALGSAPVAALPCWARRIPRAAGGIVWPPAPKGQCAAADRHDLHPHGACGPADRADRTARAQATSLG